MTSVNLFGFCFNIWPFSTVKIGPLFFYGEDEQLESQKKIKFQISRGIERK